MTRNLLLSLSLLSAGICLAAPLSPEEALNRLNSNGLTPATRGVVSMNPALTLKTQIGEPTLYVFDTKDLPGFMIVSADDAVTPLLGYSEYNNFDPQNVSPAMQSWLDQYSRQIEYVRQLPEMGINPGSSPALPNWAAIEPMLKTQWNQSAPYNDQCPVYQNQHCYTGCVATSMSQVMNYFKYPSKGQGKISYNCSSIGKTLSLDFSTLTFDWDNMLPSYNGTYNDAQKNAVSTLMKATGYSVRMSYSLDTSGAVSGLINGALVNYFGYDDQAYYAVRDLYQYTEWATLIYNNLKNIGPVIYDGNSVSSGGHSFVCDGYRGNGYFHFNWGWGGSGDGYFLLDALNPSSIGIGGGGGGFNFDQDVVLNIQPSKSSGKPTQNIVMTYGSVEGYFNDNSLLTINLTGSSMLGWSYKGLNSIVIDLGAIFEPVGNTSAPKLYEKSTNSYNKNQELDPMGYMPIEGYDYYGKVVSLRPTFKMESVALEKGVKYKVINAYLPKNTDTWIPVEAAVGSYNYFYITKTGNGNSPSDYTIENFSPMQFNCSELSFQNTLYNGIAAEVSASLTNPNNVELSRGVCLVLYDETGVLRYVGDSFVLTLSPGQSFTQNWTTVLTPQTTSTVSRAIELYAGLYDPETDTEYYRSSKPVMMEPNPGRPTYSTTLSIENAEVVNKIYQVKNSSDFDATFSIDVSKNIFSYPVMIWIANMDNRVYYKLLSYPLDAMVVNAGETNEVTINMSYPDAVVGQTYYIVSLISNNFDNAIPFVALSNGSEAGIESLVVSSDEPVIFYDNTIGKAYVKANGINSIDVYSLNGMSLSPQVSYEGDNATVDLSSLGKGIVMLTVVDAQGQRKTVKLAL